MNKSVGEAKKEKNQISTELTKYLRENYNIQTNTKYSKDSNANTEIRI